MENQKIKSQEREKVVAEYNDKLGDKDKVINMLRNQLDMQQKQALGTMEQLTGREKNIS